MRTSACLHETLAKVQTFNEADADADGKKGLAAPYGQMQKQFEEQYSSYVPANRAPDEYDVAASGATGTMSDTFFDECLSAADKLRWNMSQMSDLVETSRAARDKSRGTLRRVPRSRARHPPTHLLANQGPPFR